MDTFLDLPPLAVLDLFGPHTRGLVWHRAPGGFSGACVWRGDAADGPRVAIKAWPVGTSVERVRQVHAWMARAAHLPFVPAVLPGAWGSEVFAEDDRTWDCCRWMPGAPLAEPTAEEVSLASEAVAGLHGAWEAESEAGTCPGVANRLRILAENESLLAAGPGALPPVAPDLDPLLRRALVAAARTADGAVRELRPWANHIFRLQPCVRDPRGEHVLFAAGRVSGLIDFGAAAVDHPAGDLARLLGDFGGEDRFTAGLNAYRRARALDTPDAFVRLLARTGAVCSVLGWLVRLAVRREPISDANAVAVRLAKLVSRVESSAPV